MHSRSRVTCRMQWSNVIANFVSCLRVSVNVQSPCSVVLSLITNVLSDSYLDCFTARFITLSNEAM